MISLGRRSREWASEPDHGYAMVLRHIFAGFRPGISQCSTWNNTMNWKKLNSILVTADETTCLRLMAEAQRERPRKGYVLLRIHNRLNKVRALRERQEIIDSAAECTE